MGCDEVLGRGAAAAMKFVKQCLDEMYGRRKRWMRVTGPSFWLTTKRKRRRGFMHLMVTKVQKGGSWREMEDECKGREIAVRRCVPDCLDI